MSIKMQQIADKLVEIKNYNIIVPVITLVWLADENLGLKDDFISYIMTPETVSLFLRDNFLWEKADIKELLAVRNAELSKIDNKTKGIDFLSQNRLIYAFQKNIVKNKKFSKYFAWFDFAEKTRDTNNVAQDFEGYKNNHFFGEIIKRLDSSKLGNDDDLYIFKYQEAMLAFNRITEESKEEGIRLGIEKGIEKMQPLLDAAIKKAEQEKETAVINLLKLNLMTVEQISEVLQVSVEKVKEIQEKG